MGKDTRSADGVDDLVSVDFGGVAGRVRGLEVLEDGE
jgi:hypothetical protein